MAISFETSNRWIRAGSATWHQQNGASGRSVSSGMSNIGFYNDALEHIRFDDYGTVTNVFGSPATVLRKTQSGNTGNQNPIPMTLTAGTLPTINVRSNVGSRSGQNSFLCPLTGIYRISVSSLHAPNTVVQILINGGGFYNGIHVVGMGISYLTQAVELIRSLNAGDHVQLQSYNGASGVWGDNGWLTLTVSFVA